ncbi:MAG TPA: RagB/SusD family nutrient uptake outer membrane protein [Longimicrobiales bacterium]
MRERAYRIDGPAAALALALLASLAGCADTEVQGVIFEQDMDEPELMIGLARGVNSEFADIFLAADAQYTLDSPTDAITNDGTAASEVQLAVSDFRERPASSLWGQAHEAVWAALYADRRLKEVLPPEDYEVSPLFARMFIYGAHAERILGECFCNLIYNYGPEGGILLGKEGPYDGSRIVPSDSAFKRGIAMAQRALAVAEAAVAAGVEAPEDDPIFDPQRLVYAAHASLAQLYANLGDWAQAVQHARLVPDGFADYSHMHPEVDGGNVIADLFYQGDDLSLYRTPAALLWATDPRVALRKCGDWRSANLDDSPSVPPSSAFINMSAQCGNVAGEYRSESNRYPLWISGKYEDDNADVEIASGAEMRLIEAEAALLAGQLGEFTAQVNRARQARGVAEITAPTEIGGLEYPNAEDDAWSILDRERYLELLLEGRRFWDLRRWNHPFWTENHVLLPRHADRLPPGGRMKCFEIPDLECDTNASINCPVLTSG